jgi:two-component system, OmpR family, response regulator VicR
LTHANVKPAVILLVEDDVPLAEMLRDRLSMKGHEVWLAESGAEAEALSQQARPDLIIIDLMLPDTNGLVLCANLREQFTGPIIICTASQRPEDPVLGFKLGANDFVQKPFLCNELEARIEAHLRHKDRNGSSAAPTASPSPREAVQVIGPLAIDRARCRVTQDGAPMHLTPTEYRLLSVLADRPNHVLSAKELAERVWGAHDTSICRSLEVHLRRIRAKLKRGPATPPMLTARRGLGFELTWEPPDGNGVSQ